MYFLDTNTCIYFLNGTYEAIGIHLRKLSLREILILSIVKAELLFGLEKSKKKYEQFLSAFETIEFDDTTAYYYAKVRMYLEKKGTIIGGNDLLIAPTVLAHNGILVTHNIKKFKRVPRLSVEDWIL